MIRTILVPTDGSAGAERALRQAAEIAVSHKARVILVHALLRGHMPEGLLRAARVEHVGDREQQGDNLVNMPQEIMARVQGRHGTQLPLDVLEFSGARLLSGAEQTCQQMGVKEVERIVDEGDPAEIILDAAKRCGADLIVMGSRGLGNLSGLLLGSVSQKVCQLASCSCMLVK